MPKHGWSEHGTPCCEAASLAQRPDTVTACGGSAKCMECGIAQYIAHAGAEPPRVFDIGPWLTMGRIGADARLKYSVVDPSALRVSWSSGY